MLCFSEDPLGDFSPRGVFFVFFLKIPSPTPLSYPRGDRFPKKTYTPPRGVLKGYYGIYYSRVKTCIDQSAQLISRWIVNGYPIVSPNDQGAPCCVVCYALFFFGCMVASRGGYRMARGRHYAKLSLSNAARLSFSDLCILLFLFLSLCRVCVCVFLCSHWSLVDVPLIFFCPADHVPDWQPRVLLGMVEARSVNVKKTTTTLYI